MAEQAQGISSQQVLDALKRVRDPKTGQDIVSLGWIGEIKARFGNISFDIHLPVGSDLPEAELKSACIGAVKALQGVQAVLPNVTRKPKPQTPTLTGGLTGVDKVIVVGSGKGGVGKSTTAVNLAAALARQGFRVGLLDADIYGPSVPTMLGKGLEDKLGRPDQVAMKGELMIPFEMHGVRVMSVGMLIEKNQPTVWRAPIATKLIQQFLNGVEWGELDYLLIDLPPGTGDIQLTLSQQTNLAGAIIVTTPQKVALNIAEKGLLMFRHVGVPILGIVETMSGFGCEECGHVTPIFGASGGAQPLAANAGAPLLAQIPLDAELVRAGDAGEPIVARNPRAPSAAAYIAAAAALAQQLKTEGSKAAADVVPLAVEGIPNDAENGGRHSLAIYWSDGWKWTYGCVELRAACPCAACVDEFTGVRRVKASDIDKEVYIEKALPVGRYGVNLVWTDGHSTGIYTYKYLRELDARKAEERPDSAPPSHGQHAHDHARHAHGQGHHHHHHHH